MSFWGWISDPYLCEICVTLMVDLAFFLVLQTFARLNSRSQNDCKTQYFLQVLLERSLNLLELLSALLCCSCHMVLLYLQIDSAFGFADRFGRLWSLQRGSKNMTKSVLVWAYHLQPVFYLFWCPLESFLKAILASPWGDRPLQIRSLSAPRPGAASFFFL